MQVHASLEKNDICIYTIRGNHDGPAFFSGKHDDPETSPG